MNNKKSLGFLCGFRRLGELCTEARVKNEDGSESGYYLNRAPLETLLRVPGIGAKNAYKIIEARKYTKLSFEDLIKMRVALKRAKHFITCDGKFFGEKKEGRIRGLLMAAETQESAEQLNLFGMLSNPENGLLALHGQL